MDISDILFGEYAPLALKQAVLELIEKERITDRYIPVLKRTATNDDVNGSQHSSTGGTDFSYEDALYEDVRGASSLGYYEYFRSITVGSSIYTGNQYHGTGYMFPALVIDPPEYAVGVRF